MAEYELPDWYKQIALEADKRSAELDKQIKKLTVNIENMRQEIGGIASSNGAMAEEMIYNVLEKDKTFANIKFDEIDRNIKLKLKKFNLEGEFDIILQNGDTLAIIETKYKVREKDVFELVHKKLDNFRKLFPMFSDYKILLGIGGMSFEDNSEEDAKDKGIGIIKIVGDKVEYYTEGIRLY